MHYSVRWVCFRVVFDGLGHFLDFGYENHIESLTKQPYGNFSDTSMFLDLEKIFAFENFLIKKGSQMQPTGYKPCGLPQQ